MGSIPGVRHVDVTTKARDVRERTCYPFAGSLLLLAEQVANRAPTRYTTVERALAGIFVIDIRTPGGIF